ncbi:unnamed protein product [Rotaria sordida]|uniref:Uncharacterized protein n=2 Tax=Rotaria sordida TaxID=392033 RepID=A0A819KH75_9BILA|nr:unnamed protein product [Rotaria sordida]
MFMPYIGILLLIIAKILGEPTPTPTPTPTPPKPPTTSKYSGRPREPCEGDDCETTPNLVAPIVGSLCGILLIALISIFIIWFYLRRKYKKNQIKPTINFIEQPSLYTGAISTYDNRSKLYGTSLPPNDSISSHYYEQIQYNQPS